MCTIAALQPERTAALSAGASCQKALALGVRRIASVALKGIEKCHLKRMQGQIPATVNCNDPSALTDGALTRLQRAAAKLGTLANRRCDAAGAPAALGYTSCPAPCDTIAVTSYADVGTCLACVAQDRVQRLATTVFGAPEPPVARNDATKCHDALRRATRKYASTRMRTQQQCKTAEDNGEPVGTSCRDGDYQGAISAAWSQLQAHVATDASCPIASLVALDLCPSALDGTHVRDATAAIDLLYTCTHSAVSIDTDDLYDRVYAPGAPSPIVAAGRTSIRSRWTGSAGQSLADSNPHFRLIVEDSGPVTLDLTSSTADAFLYLLNADGTTVLSEDDNAGGGSNSRIVTTLPVGRYLLVAATTTAAANGAFTIATDRGTLKGCFVAYTGASYAGAATRFCDGGTGESFTNDTYSSLRIPEGVFVRTYENVEGSGRARTYFNDVPSLQPFLDNLVSSVEWGAFTTDDFFVTMVSDPQITWSYCSDGGGSLCTQEQMFFGAATERDVALFYNNNLIGALNTIKDSIGPRAFGGVIVNGDLTEFGRQDTDLEDYIALYDAGIGANVYPGLGNHDYANNVDDCFANICASAMVNYFATQVSSLNAIDFDHTQISTPLSGTPSLRVDHVGSYAYSFEIGDVHFVQLNNYPTYTRVWEIPLPKTDTWYTIQSSVAWLRDDLPTAAMDGKRIVANLHDWGGADVAAFRDVLDDFPVSAVYAGHYHGTYGRYVESGPYTDGAPVPVFLSGSAHYGTMIVTRFTSDKLYVWVLRVDQFNGATLQVRRNGVFEDVTDLSTLFDVCPSCSTTYEYAYDYR